MISLVVAYSKNRVIGSKNTLPWAGKMPADMQHFKALTLHKTVIMGKNTFLSIGRALPLRQNIVLSRTQFQAPGVLAAESLEEAYYLATGDIMVIGGGEVYARALDDADIVYATFIDAHIEGDIYFPELGPEWIETFHENHEADEKNKYPYSFITFTKTER